MMNLHDDRTNDVRRSLELRSTNAKHFSRVGVSKGDFELPRELEASSPPEARGIARDGVRMMVSYIGSDIIHHTTFRSLPEILDAGDVVVINTSRTERAAIEAVRDNGDRIVVHVSTRLADNSWLVELREHRDNATAPMFGGREDEVLSLAGGASLRLLSPHTRVNTLLVRSADATDDAFASRPVYDTRLWRATFAGAVDMHTFLERHGRAIRYAYVSRDWPIEYYQNVYANEPGSAEMPSAGRPFSPEVIVQLIARGVVVVPILLHTGVASLEAHEPPYEEYYRVSSSTASIVNEARALSRRVVAVGTTVVRALESAVDERGIVNASEGWSDLIIAPDRAVQSVDAILTGMHEPKASHLSMLEALAGAHHVRLAYREAVRLRYLWHEFGDVHLMLP